MKSNFPPFFWLLLPALRLNQALIILLHRKVILVRNMSGNDGANAVELIGRRKMPVRLFRVLDLAEKGIGP